jgi:hypothetical protein
MRHRLGRVRRVITRLEYGEHNLTTVDPSVGEIRPEDFLAAGSRAGSSDVIDQRSALHTAQLA